MRHPGTKLGIRLVAWIIEFAGFVVLNWTGLALGMDANDPRFGTVIAFTISRAPYLVLMSGFAIVIARISRRVAREPSAADQALCGLVGAALDKFRKECFQGIPKKEPRDNNRVTIFKRVQWKWWMTPWKCLIWPWGWGRYPGSGWLILVHRSGHTTKTSTTAFLAPDDAPQAEGVAGLAWRGDDAVRVRNLPDLNLIRYVGTGRSIWYSFRNRFNWPSSASDRFAADSVMVAQYAKATNTSTRAVWQRVRSRKRTPISILAMPLETPDNQRWGVLVLDSSNAVEPIDTEERTFRVAFTKLKQALDRYGVTRA